MTALAAITYEAECVLIRLFAPQTMDGFTNISLWGTLTNMFCVQSGWCFTNSMINNPTWYLSVLCLCYLVLCIIVRLCGRLRISPKFGFAFMVLLGCSILYNGTDLAFFNLESSRGYTAFFLGLLLAGFLDEYELRSRKYVLLSAFALLFSIFGIKLKIGGNMSMLLSFVIYPAIILLFDSEPVVGLFKAGFWSTLGKIQFHVYIWHLCLLMALRTMYQSGVRINVNDQRIMLLFVFFAEIFGAVSYFLLEKRADKVFMYFIPDKFKEKYC